MKPPATIIVGEVVRLREKLNWFERLPLFGKRIVVTRAKGAGGRALPRLGALGAASSRCRPSRSGRPPIPGRSTAPLPSLPSYDWLIFTSANGVRFFLERLDRSAADLRALRARICAIGPATRAAVEALHLKVDLMGKEYVAEGLLEAFAGHDLAGKRVLLPRAAVARDLVPAELTRRGAQVDVVEAYRTVMPESPGALPLTAAGILACDCITFTSSSTVQNFVALAGAACAGGVTVASIGPVTTRTARELGIAVTAEAREFTIDGLVEAVRQICDTRVTPPSDQ